MLHPRAMSDDYGLAKSTALVSPRLSLSTMHIPAMCLRILITVSCLGLRFAAAANPEVPVGILPGTTVQLVAMEPNIRTPTAIATDPRGRIWVLENNTHFRPKNYTGPAADRIVIMDGFGPDGLATKFTTFADDFHDGMGLKILPDGDVILSTRTETWRLRDADGDGVCDQRTRLLQLTTADTYPHNGLSSVALDADGFLYVGLGENHGVPWTLTGVDGAVVKGSDEGGIFRCDLQGKHLEHWALGFWNPWGLAFDAVGRLFCLDNDPGAGSNCRLLQIVHHGDYGYRYRYSRTIQHPFLSWAGELPGTLPYLCLSGEAPVGLLARGPELLGCTWNDHGIQRFPLVARGASFVSSPEWLIRGGNDFRPTGLAAAPDGSLVVGDWVDGTYEVHGKGRVWRVTLSAPAGTVPPVSQAETPLAELLGGKMTGAAALAFLTSADPFLVHGAIDLLAHGDHLGLLEKHLADPDPTTRLGVLLALRRRGGPEGIAALAGWLQDSSAPVKRAALKWIAEEQLTELRPKLESALSEPLVRATFEAYVAALQQIKTGKPEPALAVEEMRGLALDAARDPALRTLALRLVPADQPSLSVAVLSEMAEGRAGEKQNAKAATAGLQKAATQILASRSSDDAQASLRQLAADPKIAEPVRLEALAGLALSATKPETRAVLRQAITSGQTGLVREALRSLRGGLETADAGAVLQQISCDAAAATELGEQLAFAVRATPGGDLSESARAKILALAPTPLTPGSDAALADTGDPDAGRRLFFHPNGPRCATCHIFEGRGGAIGPDLTDLGALTPELVLEAIREPSKAIAPAYTTYHLTMRDGKEGFGIDLFKDDKSSTTLRDATGATTKYRTADVVTREPLPVSLMPPGLPWQMTGQELRDVIAFLLEK